MTQLSDILNIQITRETAPVSRASFSIPCFIASHTNFSERARVYANFNAVEEDFKGNTVVLAAAEGFFSQQVKPTQVVIGRRQVHTVNGSIGTVANSTAYTLTVDGTDFTITSASSG